MAAYLFAASAACHLETDVDRLQELLSGAPKSDAGNDVTKELVVHICFRLQGMQNALVRNLVSLLSTANIRVATSCSKIAMTPADFRRTHVTRNVAAMSCFHRRSRPGEL